MFEDCDFKYQQFLPVYMEVCKLVIGILAHVDAGKTTLSEALLYNTGQIRNLGRVDHQDAYLDTDKQERERGITIFSKQARIIDDDWEVTLLDTPGHVDFSAEMERTLQVLDYAILVISGTDGIQGHTRTLWRLLRHYNVPVFIFVNKMDMNGTDKNLIQQEIKNELSDCCIDFTMEHGDEFYEELAMGNEKMLNYYMENAMILNEDIVEAVFHREIFPCYYGSALKLTGVEEFISGLKEYTKEPEYGDEFAARVYKIGRDNRGVRLTFLKVMGGCLKVREKIEYESNGTITEKADQIRKYSGDKYETVDLAKAGEVVALTGLSATFPGQGLGALENKNVPMLEPVLNYQLILPKDVNPALFMKDLRKLEEEDPQLYVVWKEEVQEIHVQLMGEVQMEVLARIIKDRFDVTVTFGPGSIVYKETIASPVEGVGHFEPLRHYAEVHLLLSPAETGSGITVESVCSEDVLDKNWQRLISTHVLEKEHKGVLTGSVLTDVKVTILTGKAHTKHTEGGDFRQATYRAIRQGLKSAESILLEPYYNFTLEIPIEYVGRGLTDFEQRHCKVNPPEFRNSNEKEIAIIKGKGPVATLQDYVSEVNAYSKGLGHLMLELAGYDVCHNSLEVIQEKKYDSELDLENPTGSVFCAHGAGFLVPWDEVENYMHLPFVYNGVEETDGNILNNQEDGIYYDANGNTFSAGQHASATGNKGNASWEKSVARMSEVELDAALADVYAREFGMSLENINDESRRKWKSKKKDPYDELSGKPRTLRHDKKGNPIYPSKGPTEEYVIVDGYNVIYSWDDLKELSKTNIDSARDLLIDIMCNYQGYRNCNLLLVFDAYRVKGNSGKKYKHFGIEVVYTKEDETADAYIERLVHDARDKYRITVVSSDGLIQQTILSLGGLRMSSRELKEDIDRTGKAGFEQWQRQNK